MVMYVFAGINFVVCLPPHVQASWGHVIGLGVWMYYKELRI